jgi:hypothetical protein
MANGTSEDLWKGFLALFAAGAVAGWLLIGMIWGLVWLIHHVVIRLQ